MVNLKQIRDLVIEPTLKTISLYSPEASDLILYTGLQESGYRYIKQLGTGPALSFWQVEPFTANDHFINYISFRKELSDDIRSLTVPEMGNEWNLLNNLPFAVAMARIKYRRSPLALPNVGDGLGMAHIWKVAYNTHLGIGTEDEFFRNWDSHKNLML